ncbi:MAG: tyrosine-type recombinase/integrase, partial [Natronosporangium sp.]
GEVTVGQMWQRATGARRLELASRRRDESQWRQHVEPRWGSTPLGAILRPEVTGWVVAMERAGVGAWTIRGAAGVLRGLLDLAVDARLIRANPAAGVRLPRPPAHLDRVLAPEDDGRLLAALEQTAPGRTDGRLLGELMLYCGLRWEEGGGLDRDHVQLRYALVDIGPVLERDGTIRPYPKSPAGKRSVPVDPDIWPRVRARAMATEPGGLLVVSPRGGHLDYSRWYHRVWRPALASAGLGDPQPTPHDLRHTYGTRLAEAGVPPHEIMALMGHSSLSAVQRYLHPGEARFARARTAVQKGRAADERHEPENPVTSSHAQT